jgi:hypothetical protein
MAATKSAVESAKRTSARVREGARAVCIIASQFLAADVAPASGAAGASCQNVYAPAEAAATPASPRRGDCWTLCACGHSRFSARGMTDSLLQARRGIYCGFLSSMSSAGGKVVSLVMV